MAGQNLIVFARESRADTHLPLLCFNKGSNEIVLSDSLPQPIIFNWLSVPDLFNRLFPLLGHQLCFIKSQLIEHIIILYVCDYFDSSLDLILALLGAGSAPFATARDLLNTRRRSG